MKDCDCSFEFPNLWGHAVGLVSEACVASKQDLNKSISDIEAMIGTGYYEGVGDTLLKQIVLYLKERLEE